MELVDVRDLLAAPAATRALKRSEALEGLEGELARADDPIRMELRLESVVEGILVSGRLRGSIRYSCARCLKPGESGFDVEVTELFSQGAAPDDEEAYPVEEGSIDLEPMVRDAVLLGMPFSPLCRPDCLGLCERCGGDRNLGECVCAEEVDPRWAALDGLNID
ncbi:MAG TPA: DUF177 domain-containing protein [Actinomycetota bacterium]|nr:DUF177 domain-containing protein [Actinomycetota bacterium]